MLRSSEAWVLGGGEGATLIRLLPRANPQHCTGDSSRLNQLITFIVGMLSLFVAAALLPWACVGHLVTPGPCPDIKVKQDFDLEKYMGTWYGYASFGTESTQGKGKCVTARYKYDPANSRANVFNWQIPSQGYRSSINGSFVPMDPTKKEGLMKVTFELEGNRTKTFPLKVLDTDYTNWAVVYFCKNLLRHHETSGWVLTRVQELDKTLISKAVQQRVDKVLKRAKLDRDIYKKTVQDDCPSAQP